MSERRALLLVMAAFAAVVVLAPAAGRNYGPYPARIVRVVDGDTLAVEAEVWPGHTVRTMVRLAGVNAPELHARAGCEREAAERAANFVRAWAARPGAIALTLTGRDKYGRDLGRVQRGDEDLASALLAAGHVRAYHGERREGWC